jgi:hypothetical protein
MAYKLKQPKRKKEFYDKGFNIDKRMDRLKYLLESKNVPESKKIEYEEELIFLNQRKQEERYFKEMK